jgi:hypothetical protein
MTWTLHHTRQTTSKASTLSGVFGALLRQKLQCSLTVLQIRLASRFAFSLHCIRMQSPDKIQQFIMQLLIENSLKIENCKLKIATPKGVA